MADAVLVDAYIGLGSNVEPREHLEGGLRRLKGLVEIAGISTIYRSPALDHPEQPDYLNGVIHIRTSHPPRALKFDVLRPIEGAEGRVRLGDRYAPRTLDMDTLIYGDCCMEEVDLRIPDPGIRERAFLLKPLLELTPPGLGWPGSNDCLAELAMPADVRHLQADEAFTADLRKRILG